jgi:hypothetical protein
MACRISCFAGEIIFHSELAESKLIVVSVALPVLQAEI